MAEAASVMGIPTGTMKSRLHRATAALRAAVDAADRPPRARRKAPGMTADHDVDQLLRAHFEATADRTVLDGQLDRVVAATHRRRRLPGWLASLRSTTMSTTRTLAPASIDCDRLGPAPDRRPAPARRRVGDRGRMVGSTPAPIVNGPIVFGRSIRRSTTRCFTWSGLTARASSSCSLARTSVRSTRRTDAGSPSGSGSPMRMGRTCARSRAGCPE